MVRPTPDIDFCFQSEALVPRHAGFTAYTAICHHLSTKRYLRGKAGGADVLLLHRYTPVYVRWITGRLQLLCDQPAGKTVGVTVQRGIKREEIPKQRYR